MERQLDINKMKRKPQSEVKHDPEAKRVQISIKLDANLVGKLKREAYRLGIPYQTFIGSILHRFTNDELVDRKEVDAIERYKVSGG